MVDSRPGLEWSSAGRLVRRGTGHDQVRDYNEYAAAEALLFLWHTYWAGGGGDWLQRRAAQGPISQTFAPVTTVVAASIGCAAKSRPYRLAYAVFGRARPQAARSPVRTAPH